MSSPRPASPASTTPATAILVLSGDAVVAALLGALIETLGYEVHFGRAEESPEDGLRRTRPRACLIDCVDPSSCTDEFLGRAKMRGTRVLIFGTRADLARVGGLARFHDVDLVAMPADAKTLDAALRRAVEIV